MRNYLKRTGNKDIDRIIFHLHPFKTATRIVFQTPTKYWYVLPLDDRPMEFKISPHTPININCLDFYKAAAPDLYEARQCRNRNRQELQAMVHDALGIKKIVFGGSMCPSAARAANTSQGDYYACTYDKNKKVYRTYALHGATIKDWSEVYLETRQRITDTEAIAIANLATIIWEPWVMAMNFDPDRTITRCSECGRPISFRLIINADDTSETLQS